MSLFVIRAHAGVVTTKAQVDAFFGTDKGGRLVYVKASDKRVYFIDFSEAVLQEKRLCSVDKAGSPLLSPDGKLVAFGSGTWKNNGNSIGDIYICKLEANATPVKLGPGFSPHWWIDPGTQKTFIVYNTKGGKFNWPQPGETKKQEIDPSTLAAIGNPVVLLDKSFTGGLSKNGRYLCTAFNRVYLYDLVQSKLHLLNDDKQACNASITPSSDPTKQDRMMHLPPDVTVNGTLYDWHQLIVVRDKTDAIVWHIVKPPQTVEWQHPEWSTHENYCTATATKDAGKTNGYQIYLIKMDTKDLLRVVDGNNSVPHLWVPGTSGPVNSPSFDLSPTSLQFSGQLTSNDPAAKDVTVAAVNGLSLDAMTVSDDAAWLQVSPSGSGNTRTLANQVSLLGLKQGNYTATVTVKADAVTKTYQVKLVVTEAAVFTSADSVVAQNGQTFSYDVTYQNPLGGQVAISYLYKPLWATTTPTKVSGIPTFVGLDSIVVVLKVDNVIHDTLRVLIHIQETTSIASFFSGFSSRTPLSGRVARGTIVLRVPLEKKGDLSLQVFDVTGREVWKTYAEKPQPGIHLLKWNMHEQSKTGVFLIRMRHAGAESRRKIFLH